MRRLFSWFIFGSLFFVFGQAFATDHNQAGIYFSGKSARLVLMDVSSKVNLQSQANIGWDEFSIVKSCGATLSAGEKVYAGTECDLVISNSDAIVAGDITSDLSIDNSHAIVSFGDVGGTNTIIELTGGPISGDVSFEQNGNINPGEDVDIVGDSIIDGNGSVVTFASTDEPQFIVADGKTVVLQNVTFKNVNSNTFSMGHDSVIEIGKNVTFELGDDMTFKYGEIKIVDGDCQQPNVLKIVGSGGVKQLDFISSAKMGQSYEPGTYRIFRSYYRALNIR
jgi:hypothetical protein